MYYRYNNQNLDQNLAIYLTIKFETHLIMNFTQVLLFLAFIIAVFELNTVHADDGKVYQMALYDGPDGNYICYILHYFLLKCLYGS